MVAKKGYNKGIDFFQLGKVPPQDVKVEESVLAAIIDEPAGFISIAKYFSPDIFYNENCRIVAKAIYQLNDENTPIDLLTVTRKVLSFKEGTILPHDISIIYTSRHAGLSASNLDSWFKILIEFYIRREMINISAYYAQTAYDLSNDSLVLASEMADKVSKINNISLFKHSYTSSQAAETFLNHIETRDKTDVKYRKVGIPELDKYLYLDVGDVILVAGPGGSGKSKLVMSMVKHLLLHYKDFACQYFSFEDNVKTIYANWLTEPTMLSTTEMESKGWKLSENDKTRIRREAEVMKTLDFEVINDTCRINDIKTSFITFCNKRPEKFNLLIIDNIMLLHDNHDVAKMQTEIDEVIVRKLKDISLSTMHQNSAIIVLHHFTKEATTGKGKIFTGYKPEVSDIRGSTRYNDIVTKTLLINRPFSHKELVMCYPGYSEMLRDLMIIEIPKCRNGANGFVRLFANMAYNVFKTANANEVEDDAPTDMRKQKRKTSVINKRDEIKRGIII